jgi:hypothetical protein
MTTSPTTGHPAASAPAGAFQALSRRWPSALGALAATASLVLLTPLPDEVHRWVSAWSIVLAAVIYFVWGTANGDLADRRLLTAQTVAVLGFAATAMAAVATAPEAAKYVLAAGWLSHAAWDVAHHRMRRVVPRWYAETCLVADLTIAAALLTVGIV